MNLFNSEIYPNIQLTHAYTIIFIGRTDAEADAPILWPPDVRN